MKHVALGRCAHECATVHELDDGRVVVYTGDDEEDQCLYKFVSDTPGSLKSGTLYVANMDLGQWIPLSVSESPILAQEFGDSQTEMLTRLRRAADLVGGSKLARPEDIALDPFNHNVFVALTNNKNKNNWHGEIIKLVPANDDHTSEHFTVSTFLPGGMDSRFSCPDNLTFDPAGNLWFTTDISSAEIGNPIYESFGNNGLYVIPVQGPYMGTVVQVASAPVQAEFTGTTFTEDGKILFLSVQHPGELSADMTQITSEWPDGPGHLPRPGVICITGPALERLTQA